jgi:hypothetical protein
MSLTSLIDGLIDGVGGAILCIIILSLSFTLAFSAASPPTSVTQSHIPGPRQDRIARAIQWKAARAEIIARRNRIQQSVASDGFPFEELPPEIQLMILAYFSEWIPTYQALVRVSHHMYGLTLRACVPHMPITLSTTKQLSSFAHLLASDIPQVYLHRCRLYVANLVHRLWVSPLRKEDHDLGIEILRTCVNVRVLACDARTLRAAVAKFTKYRHNMCRDLTLLLSRPRWDVSLNTPSGLTFLQRLTHLRVMGEATVPRDLCCTKLTHLSYSDRFGCDDSPVDHPWALGQPTIFPSLRQIVLTRRCSPEGRALKRVGSRLIVCYVARQWTEMQLWCDMAKGRGLWSQAAIRSQG